MKTAEMSLEELITATWETIGETQQPAADAVRHLLSERKELPKLIAALLRELFRRAPPSREAARAEEIAASWERRAEEGACGLPSTERESCKCNDQIFVATGVPRCEDRNLEMSAAGGNTL